MSFTALILLISVLAVILVIALAFSAGERRPSASVERTRVLRLRDEGKLSAKEAEDLLLAMGPDFAITGPARSDHHLRRAASGLILVGIFALLAAVISSIALTKSAQIYQEIREQNSTGEAGAGFTGTVTGVPDSTLPASDSDSFDTYFETQFLPTLNFFQAVSPGFPIVAALIALGGFASGIILLRKPNIHGRTFARSVGMAIFIFALFLFPIGTLIGAYGIWVLALRQDAGRFF